jgi:hypothetical protein
MTEANESQVVIEEEAATNAAEEVEYKKELGKIVSVQFGIGGYQDAMFGVTITFEGKWGGVSWHMGCWSPSIIEVTENTKWTEEDRDKDLVAICRKLDSLLKEAKVNDVTKLVGKPVEIQFDGNTLKDWRLLTEVI